MLHLIFGAMRHFLAYMLLTIFSFQVLPVKEIGKILSKQQLTEEIHEDCEIDDALFIKEKLSFKDECVSYTKQHIQLQQKVIVAIQSASELEHQHFPDIFVPPPNA